MLELEFTDTPAAPPSGNPDRFTGRWHLVGAGLSNVWRYGNLELPATSGRLLLRGPNGTGKTTALEALWPFLIDLDHGQGKLSAGKARTTTLKQLMAEGAKEKGRRYGYAWLTVAPPAGVDEPAHVTYGVRLQYSPSASPAVTVVPFTVPARPVCDFGLETETGSALEHDDFIRLIDRLGGLVFADPESYVEDLSGRVFSATPKEVRDLASRLRQVRNPVLLADLSAEKASEALREALPNVDPAVITETADALAASETTRAAFERDRRAAEVLADFARVWAGHVTDVAKEKLAVAEHAVERATKQRREQTKAERDADRAAKDAEMSRNALTDIERQHTDAVNKVRAIQQSDAYKAAGTIRDLTARLTAERANSRSSMATLITKAEAASRETQAAVSALDGLLDQLTAVLRRARDAGQTIPEVATLLAHHSHARQVRRAGDVMASPGTGMTVVHNAAAWTELSVGWGHAARTQANQANIAQLLVTDHDSVAGAEQRWNAAAAELVKTETAYGVEQQLLTQAVRDAASAARILIDKVESWTRLHHTLCAIDPLEPELGQHWLVEDATPLAGSDPAEVLASLSEWAQFAVSAAERLAARYEAEARQHVQNSTHFVAEAGLLRDRATELRAGKLLEFPRPDWAGESDDDAALGSVLEWVDGVDAGMRDRLEVALAASGLLTAHLVTDSEAAEASTAAWSVSSRGQVTASNLTTVLTVDAEHPSADAARSVLERIELANTATSTTSEWLVIGRDGTFAAGPLTSDPVMAATADGGQLPEAGFVGARTRRYRALAEADLLEQQASELEQQADGERSAAGRARVAAGTAREDGQSFPPLSPLRDAEASRSGAARRTWIAEEARDTATTKAETARAEYRRLKNEWSRNAAAVGLPADVAQLTDIVVERRNQAREITAAREQLDKLSTVTLPRILAQLPGEEALTLELARLEGEAQQAHETAETTQALLDEVSRDSGADDAVTRHQAAEAEANRVFGELASARTKAQSDHDEATRTEAAVEPARQAATEALPAQTAAVAALHTLLTWPPVTSALDVPGFVTTAGLDPAQGLDDWTTLLRNASALLDRKPTFARKTLTERYDTAKAELAQTWTLVFGEVPEGVGVEMFELTHDEHMYDPASAAAKARELARRAEEALAEADAEALQRFVIGKIPTSIGYAWQQLQDWTREVNTKMRSAQASSGVGVRVRITPRDDLDPAAKTVFDLSCKLSDAARTEEQRHQVGKAIERRLAGANGDTMAERLADAVDITSWVDVDYMVTRADDPEKERKWGRTTGLSGGERRLVVLAPMLAAIAAGYDRLGTEALRLLPLDEVPAEVDEQGREGLARYIAQLDLDLIATSYLWDGAPGAWDGIDAHDLEAGSDGTVVAFPMMVRGLLQLPGDTEYVISPAQEP
ncbi:SbcC/MukB-like Walker B domain-containing protein [Arthrobacter sp. 35W]|uniref:SbcC/MukB-like Walker B domain-containing protein n=1 Tax=Arthrobacter sp. 35W TaxID=1132441 RepID=UPI001E2EAB38|nr:SbcC/MukB-like Walker B domain-containing protein [Arthrobacter sp. 35W]